MVLPPAKQENIKLAVDLAWEEFRARGPGVKAAGEGPVCVRFLTETYRVDRKQGTILDEWGRPAPNRLATLLLHYLTRGDGAPLTRQEIGFAQIPGGGFYEGPFHARIVSRIIHKFGKDPSLLLKCGLDLGGRRADYGDAAMTFSLFPEVPVVIVVWRGDEEFPASANFVFDASIGNYLAVEDVVVACEELVNRLSKAAADLAGESKR